MGLKRKEGRQTEIKRREWENEWEERWLLSLSTSFVVRGRDSAPTSHPADHPQAHTHTLSDRKTLYLCEASPVFICFHTNKPGSGNSSPHAARSEQLSRLDYWQQWCGAISSLSHHRGKDHSHRLLSISLFLPISPLSPCRLTGNPFWMILVVVLVWDGVSVCVGAGFRCRESSVRTEWRLFSDAAGAEVDRE